MWLVFVRLREASIAGERLLPRSVLRKLTSAFVSDGFSALPYAGMLPPPLQHLSNDLILCHAESNGIESGPALAANSIKHVAISALLILEN